MLGFIPIKVTLYISLHDHITFESQIEFQLANPIRFGAQASGNLKVGGK